MKFIWEGNVSGQETATPKANILLKHLKPRRYLTKIHFFCGAPVPNLFLNLIVYLSSLRKF